MEHEKRKALIGQLSSPEEEKRRHAMEKLKEGLAESDLGWLTLPLSDESWRVRKEAIEGLAKLPATDRLVAVLVPLMDPERELTLRNSVVEVLERIGPDAAMPLVRHLDVHQADVRKFLVDILGNIAHPNTVPYLLRLLNDPEDNIKAAAAEALAAIGDQSVCGALLSAVEGANEWFAFSLVGTLARLRCREAMPLFFGHLSSHLLSKPALNGIGAMGTLEDGLKLMELVPGLTRSSARSACIACGSIYRRHVGDHGMKSARTLREAVSGRMDRELVLSLVSQLEVAGDIDDRKDILTALGMSCSPEVLEAVLKHVEDDAVAMEVDLALLTLGSCDSASILRLLGHHDPLVRQRAVRTLERIGGPNVLERLYVTLEDESGHVRKDAAMAISALGDGSSMSFLLPLLEDEYADVAQSAARALVLLGQRSPGDLAARVVPMLETASAPLYALLIMILAEVQAPDWQALCLRAAQSTEPQVRAAAVSCLKRSDDSATVDTIINSLADENALVRGKAAVTLEELKHPEAMAPLKAALHDQDSWVRSAAVSALSVQPGVDPADFNELFEGEDLMMQTSALDALGRMAAAGNEEALEAIALRFTTGDAEVKRSVCRLLGKVENPRALDLLFQALKDEDPDIRIFAVLALSESRDPRVHRVLEKAEELDTDKNVRETARSVLEDRK